MKHLIHPMRAVYVFALSAPVFVLLNLLFGDPMFHGIDTLVSMAFGVGWGSLLFDEQ